MEKPHPQPPVEEEVPPDGAKLADRISAELELLSRNVDILEQLSGRTPKGIIRLSEALHLPIHKVRYSLHLLEREGVIQPSADGAVVTDASRQFWESIESFPRRNEPAHRAPQGARRRASLRAASEPERLLARCRLGRLGAAVAQRQSDRLLTERSAVRTEGGVPPPSRKSARRRLRFAVPGPVA